MYIISSICFPKTVFPVSLKTNVFLSICLYLYPYVSDKFSHNKRQGLRISPRIICVKLPSWSCQGLRMNPMSQNFINCGI